MFKKTCATVFKCVPLSPVLLFFNTSDVQCVNETQQFLRKLIHEVGLELRTTAVCTKVRRTRDGPFKMDHALTHQHWTADDIVAAVSKFHRTTQKIRKKDPNRLANKQPESTTEAQAESRPSNDNIEAVP